jgi:hypothetical protein
MKELRLTEQPGKRRVLLRGGPPSFAAGGPMPDPLSGCYWSYSSAHDDIASIKQSRPYLIIAQYSVDLVPIFLRDRNPLLLLLLWLLFLVSLKAAMIFLPIVDHDDLLRNHHP